LPPLEALACGARVVASDIAPHREVLGGHARFVALDVAALHRELEAVWDGEGVREDRFPDAAARLAHARTFTWERTAGLTKVAYEEALRDRVG
jgi:glycosyltransferase involved in cell wall biosynthesis